MNEQIEKVLEDAKEKLIAIINSNKGAKYLSVDELKSWFDSPISTLKDGNKEKHEQEFNSTKNIWMANFSAQVEDNILSNDGLGIISLVTMNVVSSSISKQLNDTVANYEESGNDNGDLHSSPRCSRCLRQKQLQDTNNDENLVKLVDSFDSLIQLKPCQTCSWNLDPCLFQNASVKFTEDNVSSTR